MASTSGNYPRILLGPTGADKEIEQLARSLEDDGCVVQTFSSMPVEVSLNKFDMAVLVVTGDEPATSAGPDQRIQRILHAAGFLEARLAPGRVCLLVEESVDHLDAPPVTQIRYATGKPMAGRAELLSFLGQQYPRIERDPHQHVPIREQVQSSDLRLGWVLLAAVLLIALIPLLLVMQSLAGGDDEMVALNDVATALGGSAPAGPAFNTNSPLGSATAETGSSDGAGSDDGPQDDTAADAERADGSVSGDPQLLPTTVPPATGDDERTGPTLSPRGDGAPSDGPTSTTPATDERSGPTLSPRNGDQRPVTVDATGTATLPAVCRIDTRKDLSLPGTVECEGAGRLVIEGWFGPWHNEISAVALSTGATGTLYYERAPGGGDREVALAVGTTVLDQDAARYGVNDIVATFGADGQHVHLFQSQAYGGRVATLTFTLDRP